MEIKIWINELAAINYPHSIKIEGLTNPAEGGTGQFKLETRRGINVWDYNHFFGMIGLVFSPGSLPSAVVTIELNDGVKEKGEYKIDITTSNKMFAGSKLTVQFPTQITISSSTIVWTKDNNAISTTLTVTD